MLPAYAGMIPVGDLHAKVVVGAPRVCGDDPSINTDARNAQTCSPRMRG